MMFVCKQLHGVQFLFGALSLKTSVGDDGESLFDGGLSCMVFLLSNGGLSRKKVTQFSLPLLLVAGRR